MNLPTPLNSRTASLFRWMALAAFPALILGACGKSTEPPQVVRPVRSIVVTPGAIGAATDYAGEVKPRIESRLGFRVGGKINDRRVEVGQTVKAGQVLATLDPQDLRLAQTAAKAQLDAAQTDQTLAEADFARYEDLFAKNFIGKAELDRRRANLDAARARYEQAAANWKAQSNQAAYTALTADAAGVVTGIDAEVGQVVAAGTPVIRLARSNEKEIQISIPEDRVDALRVVKAAQVSIWALPGKSYAARVREIAAAADPTTRTYQVRLALNAPAPEIQLGMTAVARFTTPRSDQAIRLPLSALAQKSGQTFVWVIDDASMTVKSVPIRLAGPADTEVLVADGLKPGQRIVTAGANLLQDGQKVKLLDAAGQAVASATESKTGAQQ